MKPARMVDLIEKDIPPLPCWIDPFVLPKRSTLLLGGATGIAKTFFLIELARALSTGTKPFGCPHMRVSEPCRVLFVDPELGEDGLQPRVKRSFSRHQPSSYGDNIYYISKDVNFRLDTEQGHEEIMEALELTKPNVLILDSIGFMHSWDEQSNTDIGELFRQFEIIKSIGIEQGLSIIFSHHFRKPPVGKDKKDFDAQDYSNFRGASKWSDAPDTIMTITRQGTSPDWWYCTVSWQKTRHGAKLPDMVFKVVPEDATSQVTFERVIGQPPPLNFTLAPAPKKS